MLIDDNPDDNFFHEREIRKSNLVSKVITMNSGMQALQHLRSKAEPHADLIFLDINMPGMDGWEFIEEYKKLDKELRSKIIIVMLTTSDHPDDKMMAQTNNMISEFKTKPLTKNILEDIMIKYF